MAMIAKLLAGSPVALGVGIALHALSAHWSLHQAQAWVPVAAEILASSVDESAKRRSTAYMPRVKYQYTFAGNVHVGDTVRFGPDAVGEGEARQLAQRFAQSARVTAYVNPTQPEQSVLDREHVSGAVVWESWVALGAVFVGGIFSLAVWRPDL